LRKKAYIQMGEADDATLSAALAELSQLSAEEMEALLAVKGMPAGKENSHEPVD
jgi:hypothetical protein